MAVYLRDRPPARRQYRSPRRATPSGVCVVHTAESFPDEVGPDTGAENVAAFIRSRSTPGSYHDLADSDSIVQLVDYDDEAFHDGTGSNPHSYGVSAATQAHRWNSLSDDWVDATVRNMARASARYARWIKAKHGVTVPARRISRAESERRVPGFLSHAQRDPARRTDPGKTFPWSTFLGYYADEMEDDMTPQELLNHEVKLTPAARRWFGTGVKTFTVNGLLQYAGAGAWEARGDRAKQLKELAAIRSAVNAEPVDVSALASELAPLLVGPIVAELGDETGITEEQAERVLRRVLGSLDDA